MVKKKKKNLLSFLFLFAFLFISFGQTLKMNFWRDDYTMLFKLQHPLEPASHFGGNGLIGSGPYKFILIPHALFFPVFELNPLGHFIVGFLIYSVAMFAIYFFVNEFLNNKKVALFASLVFAAGYISSDGLYRIINSWQNSNSQILAILAMYSLYKYLKKRSLKYYFLSLLLYFVSIEFIFVRSHSLLFIITTLDFLVGVLPNIKKNFVGFFVRQIPFWTLFGLWYLQDSQLSGPGLKERLISIFIARNFGELTPLFANIGNVLVPDKLQAQIISITTRLFLKMEPISNQIFWINIFVAVASVFLIVLVVKLAKLSKKQIILPGVLILLTLILNQYFVSNNYYWYKDVQAIASGMIGMASFVVFLFIFMVFWKKNRNAGTLIVLGWTTIVFQVLSYFLVYKDAIYESTHRYFSGAFVGYCILMGGLASIFLWTKARSKLRLINYVCLGGLFLLVFVNLKFNINAQSKFVREISTPSKNFYKELKNNIPEIEKGSLLFFDIQDSNFYQHQFDEFFSVGSMPNATAIAVYYGVDRYDFFLTSNYDEVLSKIAKKEVNINQVYSFFYGANGLENTTKDFRDLLLNGEENFRGVSSSAKFENSNTFEQKLSSLTPLLLRADILPLPLFDKFDDYQTAGLTNYTFSEKLDFINYLKSKKDYYKQSRATALSDWQYEKVDNILDNDVHTSWRGDRLYWHDNGKEAVTVDLGSNKQISKIIWVNSNHYWTPISYTIETSLNNLEWNVVKSVDNAEERKDGEVVIEEFSPTLTRFVKMSFSKTVTDDSPAISELEVVEDKYSNVDIINTDSFIKNPFAGTVERNELISIYNVFAPLVEITISISTDKGELINAATIPVNMGERAVYESIIPAYGTSIESITFEIKNIPTQFNLYDLSARNMNFSELETKGLIKIYE